MAYSRTIVLAIAAAGLLLTPARRAQASYTNLVGNVASYTSPDVWEVQCPGGTEYLEMRMVASSGSADKFVAIAVGMTPRPIYGFAAVSEVFGPGGPGSFVYLDRPFAGRMKVLVTVKQTAG